MRDLHKESGFTLIEVLLAMTLLVIGLLGVAALTGGIMKGNIAGDKVTTATVLAQQKMEDIKRAGYIGTPVADTTDTEAYNAIANFPLYKRVTFYDADNPAAGMKRITVTVFWNNDASSMAMETILAQ